MKIRQKIFILVLLSFGLYGQRNIPDVVTKVATSAANWLKIETGARAIGMGGAQAAAGIGVAAIPYNPAGIAFIDGSETYYSKSNYLVDISHNVLAYGRKLTYTDFVGFHLFYLNSGPIGVTNERYPDGTGEDYHVIDLAFRVTYAKILTDRLRIGLSLKYIREQIYTTYMQSFSLDIGSNFATGIYGFILGMSVSNFGPEVQFHGEGLEEEVPSDISVDSTLAKVTEKFPLPLVFRLGVSNDLIGSKSEFYRSDVHRLTIAADGINPIDYTVYGSIGLEYAWRELGFLRIGTHIGHDTADLSFGGGLHYKVRGLSLGVDYAYMSWGILENTHQYGINIGF